MRFLFSCKSCFNKLGIGLEEILRQIYKESPHPRCPSRGWSIKKPDRVKIWPVTKNPQFLSYHDETWPKWQANEMVFITKFHTNSSKILDFLLIFKFRSCLVFYGPVSTYYDFRIYNWFHLKIYCGA